MTSTRSSTGTTAPASGRNAAKIDHRKILKHLYTATSRPAPVDVPTLSYLTIEGRGDPGTAPEYADAVQALFAVAYAAKFALRRNGGPDQAVMPLEGLWWAPDMSVFVSGDRDEWRWNLMIMQPEAVTAEIVQQALAVASAKAPAQALDRLLLRPVTQGRAVQVLHLGPYADEGPTIAGLHAFIADRGQRPTGPHHEIYLGDPRRVAPERLRTIIRQPVTDG